MRLPGRPAPAPTHATASSSRGGVGRSHGVRAVAVVALACAALMGVSAPAQAQTDVLSATLTVKDLGSSIVGCSNGIAGGYCSDFLADDEFTYDSTDYAIIGLFVRPSGSLEIFFDPDLTTATQTLTLDVAGTTFAFADATTKPASARYWSNSGLSWTVGDPVVVKLTETVPTITDTEVTSSPASGDTYRHGETIAVTVTFSEAVDVTGTVLATLWFSQSMATYRSAPYVRGSGTTALVFEYTVAEGDTDTDGLQAGPHLLAQGGDPAMGVQGGGTITRKDASTVAAVLTSAALFSNAFHKVDGSPPTVPGAPVLTAVANGATQIDLSWTIPDNGGSRITVYRIVVSADGGTTWTALVGLLGAAISFYEHTGLTGGTTRHYRVAAENALGAGTASNVDSATTAAATPGIRVSTTMLSVEEGLPRGNSYTVRLDTQPTGNVTVTITGQAGTNLTVISSPLTFTSTDWNQEQTVRLGAAADNNPAEETVTLRHAATGGGYDSVAPVEVRVTITQPATANTPATGNPFITGLPTPQVGQSLFASLGSVRTRTARASS